MDDRNRIELVLEKHYKNQLLEGPDIVYLNHGLLDLQAETYAERLITEYNIAIQELENIFNKMSRSTNHSRIRLYNVQNKIQIHNIHQNQQSQLVSFDGNVTKTTNIFNQMTVATYQCSQCFDVVHEHKGYDEKIKKTKKMTCPNCGRSNIFQLDPSQSKFEDVQIITIQERREDAKNGYKPEDIQCIFKEDMVQTVKAGDKVTVNGIVELRNKNQNNRYTEYINTLNCKKEDDNYDEIVITPEEEAQILEVAKDKDFFNKFRNSIAPSINGNNEVKEAITLQLFSCDRQENYDNTTTRGDIHILLVGDAGLGKSQILKYVSNIAPRATYTSGKSSTGAGLTASAVRDANDTWTLEAGAMVLADKGVLCIDEFDKMSENDRSSIHEALEQQTISVAKAGLTTTLDSRCSVLAAANPKFGSFDQFSSKSLSEQINLSDTLLSRFDLIFVMMDNLDNDDAVISSIFQTSLADKDDYFEKDFITKYVAYARRNVNPQLTRELQVEIANFYKKWRRHNHETNSGTPVTTRQAWSIIRLAKASARARLSNVVEYDDLQRAINLEQYCINQFEAQLVDTNVEEVGYKEDLSDERTHDAMSEKVRRLADDYDNMIPSNTLVKTLQELDLSKAFIKKWLGNMDSNGNMVCDVSDNSWSCNQSWLGR